NTLVCDIIEASWAATGEEAAADAEPSIRMSDDVAAAANILREFMFQRVYLLEARQEEAEQAKNVVRVLYEHYSQHPEEIESDFVIAGDPPWRRAADYVAGMTDRYALTAAERLGTPTGAGRLAGTAPDDGGR
ncbi:MAG TPA: hypothetical protein VIW01_03730, partial [Dehalococcoidia bacterium]